MSELKKSFHTFFQFFFFTDVMKTFLVSIVCSLYAIFICQLRLKSILWSYDYITIDSSNFVVDIVYTWVNGSDPYWDHRRIRAENATNVKIDKKTVHARYFDFNELVFSIRSVEKYIPWFNKIYIITDNQVNHFFKPNPRIIYVDHKQIFPPDALPNYNSNAIEFLIANIPGLSEHFLYLNDDCFFSRSLPKSTFFDLSGRVKIYAGTMKWVNFYKIFKKYEKSPYHDKKGGIQFKLVNYHTLITFYEATHIKPPYITKHSVFPCSKTLIKESYKLFHNEINKTVHSTFRSYKNLHFQLMIVFVASIHPELSIIIANKKDFVKFINLRPFEKIHDIYLMPFIKHQNYMTVCINTCQKTIAIYQIIAKKWLNKWLGQRSSFEIPNSEI